MQEEERRLIDATRNFIGENPARSWWELLSTVVGLGMTAWLAIGASSMWIRAIGSVIEGLLIVRGFILYHDHMHNALLRNSRIAKAFFWVYGVLVLTPPRVWRQTHNYHHAHNSKIVGSHVGSFPILTVEMYQKATTVQRCLYRITRHPLNIVFGYFTIFAYGMCISPFLRRPKQNWDSAFALILHIALVVGLIYTIGWETTFFAFSLPLMIACACGGYLFYIQHNFEDMVVQPRHEWNYVRAALKSSSYLELGPIMSWFTGNIGYHHVHHLNPRIPFYRLPEAMKEIPELQNPGRTTLRLSDIRTCFRCKLWDPKTERMVPLQSADPQCTMS